MQKKRLSLFMLATALTLTLLACQSRTPESDPVEADPANTPEVSGDPATAAAPTEPTTAPAGLPSSTAAFEPADCAFTIPDGTAPECGYLTVPEARDNPNSNMIRLHVAIFRSDNPAPSPVVYLSGGPGGEALDTLWLSFDSQFGWLLETRDFIIFDQRGVGFSEPSLACPEIVELTYEYLDDDIALEDGIQLSFDAAIACQDRLQAEGIDLSSYNSIENAADLNDLRIALGYDQWDLFGVSYGTRLALTTMRDFPEGLRAVVLDSTYPLEVNLNEAIPANVDRVFRVFFDACAASDPCTENYPDLETRFYETVAQLDQQPVTFPITTPIDQETYDFLLDGSAFMGLLFQSLYATDVIPTLPRLIFNASEGDFAQVAQLQGAFLINVEFLSHGMYNSVQCNEETRFSTTESLEAAAAAYPDLLPLFGDSAAAIALCDAWASGTSPDSENDPVTSDIPTIIIAGGFDPVTPPAWGQQVQANLPNSFYFEYPEGGHGPSFNLDCTQVMVINFLDNPTAEPDDACIAELTGPNWRIPLTEITLIPFTEEQFGMSGVIPEGWDQIAPGTYGNFDAATAQLAIPGVSSDTLLGLMLTQLGEDGNPEPAGNYESDFASWTLYEIITGGATVYIGVADGDGVAYMVLLQTPIGDEAFYYDNVFFPMLDAFVVE